MKKDIFYGAMFLACVFCSASVYADAVKFSKEELTKQADLVITGEVIKVKSSGTNVEIVDGIKGELDYAMIEVRGILKGETQDPIVVVEFVKLNHDLEADVQDPQFAAGDKGTAYLKQIPDSHHYQALGGWYYGWNAGDQ